MNYQKRSGKFEMKAVILAGGLGTRLSEETTVKPKPMVEIGGMPILWHIMKIYGHHGVNEFIICCGYKGYVIKEYFANYFLHQSDVTIDLADNSVIVHRKQPENWKVTLIDTGQDTQTGGRLKRIRSYLDDDEDFCFTYGDGVGDINITQLIEFHKNHKRLATLSAMRPPGRYGVIKFGKDDQISSFQEKPDGEDGWINGGFFVLKKGVIDRIPSDTTVWEQEPLQGLARDGQLYSFKHNGFWQPMDTLREKKYLDNLWINQTAPWRTW